jgi:hypothetical protein
VISTYQQGHQAFPLVKLKDSVSNILGHAYHSVLPMIPIRLDHIFPQTPNLHLHTASIEQFHAKPLSNKHVAINMGRYHVYNESPNEFSFMDEDLGLTTDESDFDQYDFYYDLEELQEPADPCMTDNDFISAMQLPISQRWSYFLNNAPAQHDDEMFTAYPDLIAYATDLEAELDCPIHTIQLCEEIYMLHWYLTSSIT